MSDVIDPPAVDPPPDPATPASPPPSESPTDPATPLYPPSAANALRNAWRQSYLDARVPPTLPEIDRFYFPPDYAERQRAGAGAGTSAATEDPEAALRMHPQTINAEYLGPMQAVIDDALSSGDFTQLLNYAENIAQEQGVALLKKVQAAQGELTPHATTITATVGTDNAVADGTAANTVDFVVTDQYGQPMAAALVVTCDMGTATPTPANGTSDATTGSLAVSVVDTVAEVVSVSAASGAVATSASVTFGAAS